MDGVELVAEVLEVEGEDVDNSNNETVTNNINLKTIPEEKLLNNPVIQNMMEKFFPRQVQGHDATRATATTTTADQQG